MFKSSRCTTSALVIFASIFSTAVAKATLVFDGSGLAIKENCVVSNEQVATPPSLKDLHTSVRVSRFAPLQNDDGSPLSLDESIWTTSATTQTAHCDRSLELLYAVQVSQPATHLTVFVSAENARALTNLISEFAAMPAPSAPIVLKTAAIEVIDGSPEDVICTSSSSLNVRDGTLKNILFAAPRLETVKKTQGWEASSQSANVGGKTYTFIQVQFPKRNSVNGWVAKDFVKNRSECGTPTPSIPSTSATVAFPTVKRPSVSYLTGMRAFGASRGGGKRLHAASDLYRVKNEEVVSVAAGTVIRDLYSFYEGTYALEVKQSDGRIVRYGEITGKRAPNIKPGAAIKAGQTLGYVGKVNSGCCTPMLHFEMYSGRSTGPLTTSGNKYIRRSDLLNPSQDLRAWEKKTFGASY